MVIDSLRGRIAQLVAELAEKDELVKELREGYDAMLATVESLERQQRQDICADAPSCGCPGDEEQKGRGGPHAQPCGVELCGTGQ
jgi:hypothetical protein